ncbi:hypothetical protein [Belliella pelovolcani]|uniref:hypothetical protein n=1 Tax=Belliella pelovolcani TaxID=529505 RepID=UPI00391BC1D5
MSEFDLKFTLILIILVFSICSIIFFLATLTKRIFKIKEDKKKKLFQIEIDKVIFGIMFDQDGGKHFTVHGKSTLFKKLMIKSLIGLHDNFSGISAVKMEEFFVKSGLVNYSLSKIRSRSWVDVVEGMRDLSSLNYKKAYPEILKISFEGNDIVHQEKLLARIRLNGLQELHEFKSSKVYFNDWTQSNIIFVVKKHRVPNDDLLPDLLYATNKSISLLAIRLIDYYQDLSQMEALREFKIITKNKKLQAEIDFLLKVKTLPQV